MKPINSQQNNSVEREINKRIGPHFVKKMSSFKIPQVSVKPYINDDVSIKSEKFYLMNQYSKWTKRTENIKSTQSWSLRNSSIFGKLYNISVHFCSNILLELTKPYYYLGT